MAEIIPRRGRVYMADIGHGLKPWLVISNTTRNEKLDSCLAVRITTTPKPELDSIVPLNPADPLVGRVLCDDIAQLYRDELNQDTGAVSPVTMRRVNAALAFALSLPIP
ncbi:type II toxin-antitoxin system PemK/MazF family toxin [Streptomyces cinereoruber]|uniref:type II toxin-antitoxin system PemK/MazF family toxin n=1 Tax=Streptomyces cinereoruber TaxID=67260 RepID=UPI0036392CD3